MNVPITKTQWAIAAMATVISFCGSYFLFDALDAPRSTAVTTVPAVVSKPVAQPVPASTSTPKVAPTPTTTVPKATTVPAPKPADKKADCGDGVCVSPENPDRCPADCPVR